MAHALPWPTSITAFCVRLKVERNGLLAYLKFKNRPGNFIAKHGIYDTRVFWICEIVGSRK